MSAGVALMVNGLHVRGPFTLEDAIDTAAWLFEGAEEGERCFAVLCPGGISAEEDSALDQFVNNLIWARECAEEGI